MKLKQKNINIFEKNIFNKCLTTDEYKLIIQDVINLYSKGKNLNELLDITNSFNNRPTDSINATQQLLYASGDGLTVGNASNTFLR